MTCDRCAKAEATRLQVYLEAGHLTNTLRCDGCAERLVEHAVVVGMTIVSDDRLGEE